MLHTALLTTSAGLLDQSDILIKEISDNSWTLFLKIICTSARPASLSFRMFYHTQNMPGPNLHGHFLS